MHRERILFKYKSFLEPQSCCHTVIIVRFRMNWWVWCRIESTPSDQHQNSCVLLGFSDGLKLSCLWGNQACPLPGTGAEQKGLAFRGGPCAPPEVPKRLGPTPQAPTCQVHGAGLKRHTLHFDYLQVRQSVCVELFNKSLLLLNWPGDSQRQSYRAFFMFWMIYPCFTCPPLLCEVGDLDTAVLHPILISKPNNFRLCLSLHPLCFLPTHGWKVFSVHRALNTLPKEMWEGCAAYISWN